MTALDEVEERNTHQGIGAMAFRIYQGARIDGATVYQAFLVTTAYFHGLIGSSTDETDDQ